ncbi:MAG: glycosyltransferase family 2 protein [Xanthomonadales bacterium]|nr:glycosyltransferase family 2 protein [Xanthomonadales bacterium]
MTEQPARLRPEDIAVVIPALNEALRIREVVEDALAHCPRVIVVDDGSDDGTAELIADLPVTVLTHPQRRGKGASLRDGFAEALRQGAKAVATMDGDGQHSAADIPRMIDSANRYPDCVIVGARLRKRGCQPWYRRIGNDFGDWGISWACGFRMVDTQSGQRLYPAAACAMQDVPGEDFVYEAQMLISSTRRLGLGVVALPVDTRYADAGHAFRKSHFRLWRDLRLITAHVVLQVLRHGNVIGAYRRTRGTRPMVDDPTGKFAGDSVRHQPTHTG